MLLPQNNHKFFLIVLALSITALFSCNTKIQKEIPALEKDQSSYIPPPTEKIINRATYSDKLYGFWLGTCIANWTGLVTEMDKIGNIGEIKTCLLYTSPSPRDRG